MKKLGLLLTVLVAACGDNDNHNDRPDATPQRDASPDEDAPPDAPDGPTYTPPDPIAIPISATGPDQLQSVVAGPAGTFYAAGFSAPSAAGLRNVIVVKLTPTGLDTSFGGGDGIATTTMLFAGGSDEIDIALQSTGKILVSATIVDNTNPADRDVAVARLDATGVQDPTFAVAGVRRLELSVAHNNGTMLVGFDSSRSLAVNAADEIFIHAAQRGEGTATGGGPRTDTDFVVAKLSPVGRPVLAYGGGDGKYVLDIQEVNATPRGIVVLADGSAIAGGYANTPGLGSVQPVLYKLSTTGTPVEEFATDGLFHDVVLAVQTEVYGVALHGTQLVTGGYGRDSGDFNDWVSMRFDAVTGVRDPSWGGAPKGAVVVDPSGTGVGDNCRNAVAMPEGKTILIGSSGPGNMPAQDAAFLVLAADGTLDPDYGGKAHLFPFGNNGFDQFWGAAVSGDHVMIVGFKGAAAPQTDGANDDAYVLVLPVE